MRRTICLLALTAFLLLLAGAALAHTNQTPSVDWDVVANGGGHFEQGGYSLDNTLGQPVVGHYSAGNTDLCVGYWCRPQEMQNLPPVAAFSATPRQGQAPLSVDFSDTSTYTPTEWLWAFGDGGTAAVQYPNYVYNNPGVYSVTLTVSNSFGSDALTRPNYITVTDAACVSVTGVSISGPTVGLTDTLYSFVATVTPDTADEPIEYVWSPAPDSGQGTAVVSYTWTTTGAYTIALDVSNCGGMATANDEHDIEIREPTPGITPVQAVEISGPITGVVDTAYTFTATVSPPDASEPITYTWSPAPDSGQGTPVALYTWTTAGSKSIAVVAENVDGGASDTHVIDISDPACVGVTGVSISGPTVGLTDTLYSFVATVTPDTADEPIEYVWSPAPDSGQGTAVVSYTWTTTGAYTIVLDVSNCGGMATANDDHDIEIREPTPGITPVQAVEISGPITGVVDTAYTFTATVSPPDASEPITYTWSPAPDSGQGTPVALYTWVTTGSKSIAVTAENVDGGASDTHVIDISDPSVADHSIYLPLVMRNFE